MNLYENIKVVEQPDGMTLFRHQLASIYNMEEFETKKINKLSTDSENYHISSSMLGVLADHSGYGKTRSIIGLIMRDLMEWDMNTPYCFEKVVHHSNYLVTTISPKYYDRLNTTIILISPSIVRQWEEELNMVNIEYITITSLKNIEKYNPDLHKIVIVTPITFNALINSKPDMAWKRFIFDEPSHIKVAFMSKIIAGFYWFVTATPALIAKTYGNSRRPNFITDILSSYIIDSSIIIKNDIKFIEMSYQMPQINYLYYECKQIVFRVLYGIVSEKIQTMIEAGDISNAILSLGGCKTDNIIELVKKQKMKQLETIDNELINCKEENIELCKKITDMKDLYTRQLNEIDTRFENILTSDCSICASVLTSPIMEPECQNLFCGECLLTWLKNSKSCPLCRVDIEPSSLIYIDDKKNVSSEKIIYEKPLLTKPQTVLNIINSTPNGKFLIFSDYDNGFIAIQRLMVENKIIYKEIKGSVDTRHKNVVSFTKGSVNVILLNTIHNGSGLNLQETTDIILYHKMSESSLHQIIGRANRIGRVGEVRVHQL